MRPGAAEGSSAAEAGGGRRDAAAPCPPVEWGDLPAGPDAPDRAGLPSFWVDRPAKVGKKKAKKAAVGRAAEGLVGCGEVAVEAGVGAGGGA